MYNVVTLESCMWKLIYVPEIIILYEPKSVFLNCFSVAAHFKLRKMIARKNLDDISNRYVNLILLRLKK